MADSTTYEAIQAAETFLTARVHFAEAVGYPFVLALYAAMTHCYNDCGFVVPYLGIRANTESAGKTRLMQLVGSLCHNPSPLLTNPSGASLLRRIDRDQPTLLVDESEELQNTKSDTYEIFNSGYKPGGIVPRAQGAGEVEYKIYGPKIFGMIGDPDRTLRSRSIMVYMEKGDIQIDDKEQVFRPIGNRIGVRLATLVAKHVHNIESTYLGGLNVLQAVLPIQREREIWECLFTTCKHITPSRWDELIEAAQAISTLKTRPARRYSDLAEASVESATYQYAMRLLADSYAIAKATGERNIHTLTLVAELVKLPTWKYFSNHKGVKIGDPDGHYVLAAMLQIARGNATCPKPVKVKGQLLRGYTVAWLAGSDLDRTPEDEGGYGVTEFTTPADRPIGLDRTLQSEEASTVPTPPANSVTPLPGPDVISSQGFLTQAEADTLLAEIVAHKAELKQNYIQLYGRRAIPRLEAWYGSWDYAYSNGIILKAAPIPAYLQAIFTKLEAAGFGSYNAVLINFYRDGHDHIAPHSDADYGDDEPTIPSLTLGATRPFRLARIAGKNKLDKTTTVEYLPGHGDLLVMRGRTNKEWQRWVPRTTRPVGERYNLTFRYKAVDAPTPLFTILPPDDEADDDSVDDAPICMECGCAIKGCRYIYAPVGQAGEYAALAANPYLGCGFLCGYCYVPKTLRFRFTTQEERDAARLKYPDKKQFETWLLTAARQRFNAGATPRKDYLKHLTRDAKKYQAAGIHEQVMLSFTSDVYNPFDISLTRPTIETLIEYGLGFCVLTKSGTYSLMDLDLYRPDRDAYACTLTTMDDTFSRKWERAAALSGDRIKALKTFHDAGIFTWVSLEPVIDTEASLALVKATHKFVDLYKVGRANYLPMTETIDWENYTHRMLDMLDKYNAAHYIKHDLQCYLPTGYSNPMRVQQHH